jgi:hypothetical protein
LLLSYKQRGMRLRAIAQYIYNENLSLFEDSEQFNRLYFSIQGYLSRQCKSHSTFEPVPNKRGWFRITEEAERNYREDDPINDNPFRIQEPDLFYDDECFK